MVFGGDESGILDVAHHFDNRPSLKFCCFAHVVGPFWLLKTLKRQAAIHVQRWWQEHKMRELLFTALFGIAMGIAPIHAEIVVKLRPPISIHEHRTVRPSRRHVWVGGYHRYDGNAYAWQSGRWEEPPREHAVWVAPRWQHRHDGYVFVEGRWR